MRHLRGSASLIGSLVLSLALAAQLVGCGAHPGMVFGRAATAEELSLMAQGWLPANYGALVESGSEDMATAMARGNMPGPFSNDFGDPGSMLDAARFATTHGDYARFLRSLKRGDIVLVSQDDPTNFVSKMTGGPFSHVMLCTDASVPAQFIEAMGITGVAGDTTGDQVRRTSAAPLANEHITLRIMRPTGGASDAVDRSIAFATAQLGKPYNYTFSDAMGGDNAFYCSSLVARAIKAAGYPMTPSKDPARDRLLQAFNRPVMSLQPDNAVAIATSLMKAMHRVPAPTSAEFAQALVEGVLSHSAKTAPLVATVTQKQRLESAIGKLMSGKAFPRYARAAATYKADVVAGKLSPPVLGCIRKTLLEAEIIDDFTLDTVELLAASDIHAIPALKALGAVTGAMGPYLDVYAAYFTGSSSATTHAAAGLLDALNYLHPLALDGSVAEFGPRDVPGAAPFVVDTDFVSPTDLAWANEPHEDFNLVAGQPITGPWPYAVVPASGDFLKLALLSLGS